MQHHISIDERCVNYWGHSWFGICGRKHDNEPTFPGFHDQSILLSWHSFSNHLCLAPGFLLGRGWTTTPSMPRKLSAGLFFPTRVAGTISMRNWSSALHISGRWDWILFSQSTVFISSAIARALMHSRLICCSTQAGCRVEEKNWSGPLS